MVGSILGETLLRLVETLRAHYARWRNQPDDADLRTARGGEDEPGEALDSSTSTSEPGRDRDGRQGGEGQPGPVCD